MVLLNCFSGAGTAVAFTCRQTVITARQASYPFVIITKNKTNGDQDSLIGSIRLKASGVMCTIKRK